MMHVTQYECPQKYFAGIRVVPRVICLVLLGRGFFLCQSMQEKLPVAGSLAYSKAYADIKICEERKKMMKEKLQNIKEEALKAIEAADMPEKLNDVRVSSLVKGETYRCIKGMKDVAPEDRPKVGQMVNETRAAIEAVLEENKEKMEKAIRAEKLKKEVNRCNTSS